MYFSLTSYDVDTRQWVDRPYVYVLVPLLGPAGAENWQQTWVTFHFTPKGFTDRKLKRSIDMGPSAADPRSNTIRTIWADWPIGKGVTAAEALKAAEAK